MDRQYAILRSKLEKSGTLIGPNDMLIAAHANSLGLILVTADFREFSQVPGLGVETGLINPTGKISVENKAQSISNSIMKYF